MGYVRKINLKGAGYAIRHASGADLPTPGTDGSISIELIHPQDQIRVGDTVTGTTITPDGHIRTGWWTITTLGSRDYVGLATLTSIDQLDDTTGIFKAAHPIGEIIETDTSLDPNTLGGTWTRLPDAIGRGRLWKRTA